MHDFDDPGHTLLVMAWEFTAPTLHLTSHYTCSRPRPHSTILDACLLAKRAHGLIRLRGIICTPATACMEIVCPFDSRQTHSRWKAVSFFSTFHAGCEGREEHIRSCFFEKVCAGALLLVKKQSHGQFFRVSIRGEWEHPERELYGCGSLVRKQLPRVRRSRYQSSQAVLTKLRVLCPGLQLQVFLHSMSQAW